MAGIARYATQAALMILFAGCGGTLRWTGGADADEEEPAVDPAPEEEHAVACYLGTVMESLDIRFVYRPPWMIPN